MSGDGPWWDDLDPGFWRHEEPFETEDSRDTRSIRATAATDHVIRTVFASLLAGVALPQGYHPGKMGEIRRHMDFYGPIAEAGDPHAFFRDPPRNLEVRSKPPGMTGFRPWDGRGEELSFISPFEPLHPDLRARWKKNRNNRVARARYWQHRNGPRPTLVAVHGFAAEAYVVNEWFFNIPWIYGMGCDVLLVTMPFHGKRQSRLSPFSGHGFFSQGLGWTNEAFAQAVHDIRIFVRYLLEKRGVPAVGVAGVSLGGHTSALLASVEDRLSFSVPNVPVASLVDLVLQWQPMGTAARGLLKATGITIPELRRLAAVSCPLTWKPVLPKENLMIIGGAGDRLAPPKHSRLLWEHWDRPRIHWFPGSHLLHLDRGAYLWQLARFLRGIGFLPADHPAPGR
ncbi:MAG: alpha/beta hydrolase [Alphaproteobacteria bacterium]|nr:alpha/beta hydrolase [Alphaproteobacteria bacterium]